MFRKLFGFIILVPVFYLGLNSQMITIGIQGADHTQRVSYQAMGDEVVITTADSFPIEIARLKALEQVTIQNTGTFIKIFKEGNEIGRFNSIIFWTNDKEPRFNLNFERQKNPHVTYYDNLIVKIQSGELTLLNRVRLDNYIEGVVQAEAGIHKSLEFFKVQAVSARTFALCHLNRHRYEGFDLCDRTHCQAYNGVVVNNLLIGDAVLKTKNEVIVFQDSLLIDAVFSANCGGYTANSEDVWIGEVSYLRAVPDYNFCEGFSNHDWHASYSRSAFLSKMGTYHKTEVTRYEVIPDISGRVKKVVLNGNPSFTISGEELRRIFSLKSSRFHVYEAGGFFFLEGEGFGHGVGMCQDGAYQLAVMGFDYLKIILHYYQDIEIRKIDEVKVNW